MSKICNICKRIVRLQRIYICFICNTYFFGVKHMSTHMLNICRICQTYVSTYAMHLSLHINEAKCQTDVRQMLHILNPDVEHMLNM